MCPDLIIEPGHPKLLPNNSARRCACQPRKSGSMHAAPSFAQEPLTVLGKARKRLSGIDQGEETCTINLLGWHDSTSGWLPEGSTLWDGIFSMLPMQSCALLGMLDKLTYRKAACENASWGGNDDLARTECHMTCIAAYQNVSALSTSPWHHSLKEQNVGFAIL